MAGREWPAPGFWGSAPVFVAPPKFGEEEGIPPNPVPTAKKPWGLAATGTTELDAPPTPMVEKWGETCAAAKVPPPLELARAGVMVVAAMAFHGAAPPPPPTAAVSTERGSALTLRTAARGRPA